jgi:hypothetical protein
VKKHLSLFDLDFQAGSGGSFSSAAASSAAFCVASRFATRFFCRGGSPF